MVGHVEMVLMAMYPKTKWTLIGIAADGDDFRTLHLGTRNFNDMPFSSAKYGISICGLRITESFADEQDPQEACIQCRMIITEFIGDPDGET